MYIKSMKSPSKATGLWFENTNDSMHRRRMAAMGLFIDVSGKLICFPEKFSMTINMAANIIPI